MEHEAAFILAYEQLDLDMHENIFRFLFSLLSPEDQVYCKSLLGPERIALLRERLYPLYLSVLESVQRNIGHRIVLASANGDIYTATVSREVTIEGVLIEKGFPPSTPVFYDGCPLNNQQTLVSLGIPSDSVLHLGEIHQTPEVVVAPRDNRTWEINIFVKLPNGAPPKSYTVPLISTIESILLRAEVPLSAAVYYEGTRLHNQDTLLGLGIPNNAILRIEYLGSTPGALTQQIALVGYCGAGKTTLINQLTRQATHMTQDMLPIGSGGTTPTTTAVSFVVTSQPLWTVQIVLDPNSASVLKMPTPSDMPSELAEYISDLKKIGARPTPLAHVLRGPDGNVYYGRDGSGTTFYGDFSAEGCAKLVELCYAIIRDPKNEYWFGDLAAAEDSQICLPLEIRITLSVDADSPWRDVTIVDTMGVRDVEGQDRDAVARQLLHQALRERFTKQSDVYIVAYVLKKGEDGVMKSHVSMLELINRGFHPSLPRCMICIGENDKDLSRARTVLDPQNFLPQQQTLYHTRNSPNLVGFVQNNLKAGLEQTLTYRRELASVSTRIAAVGRLCTKARDIAQDAIMLHLLLNNSVKDAYESCGVATNRWGLKYNTLQANCERGGNFTPDMFSQCVRRCLTSNLHIFLQMSNAEAELCLHACKFIATSWLKRLQQTLNGLWLNCHASGPGAQARMMHKLQMTFTGTAVPLTDAVITKCRSALIHDVTAYELHEIGKNDQWFENPAVMLVDSENFLQAYPQGQPSFGFTRGAGVWVKIHRVMSSAQQEYTYLKTLEDHCRAKKVDFVAPKTVSQACLSCDLEMEFLDNQTWCTLQQRTPTNAGLLKDKLRAAVDIMHEANVFHMALKPGHVLFKEDDGKVEVRFIDFSYAVNCRIARVSSGGAEVDAKMHDETCLRNLFILIDLMATDQDSSESLQRAMAALAVQPRAQPTMDASSAIPVIRRRLQESLDLMGKPDTVDPNLQTLHHACVRVMTTLCDTSSPFSIENVLSRSKFIFKQLEALGTIIQCEDMATFVVQRDELFPRLQQYGFRDDSTKQVIFINRAKLRNGWHYYVGQTSRSYDQKYPSGKHTIRTANHVEWENSKEQEHVILCRWGSDEDKICLQIALMMLLQTTHSSRCGGENLLIVGASSAAPKE
eukprot:PhF_6_TR7234/c0_g1_i1/m.10806